jgi:hypothetical protein
MAMLNNQMVLVLCSKKAGSWAPDSVDGDEMCSEDSSWKPQTNGIRSICGIPTIWNIT